MLAAMEMETVDEFALELRRNISMRTQQKLLIWSCHLCLDAPPTAAGLSLVILHGVSLASIIYGYLISLEPLQKFQRWRGSFRLALPLLYNGVTVTT